MLIYLTSRQAARQPGQYRIYIYEGQQHAWRNVIIKIQQLDWVRST
jgi:hypothetical protein